MKRIYVVTDAEAGWDCVRGVFTTKELAYKYILDDEFSDELDEIELDKLVELKKYSTYFIHETYIDRV